MSDESNINKVVLPIITFLLIGLITVVVETRLQVQGLKDFERYKQLFWQLERQTKAKVNEIIVEWNRKNPDDRITHYEWDIEDTR